MTPVFAAANHTNNYAIPSSMCQVRSRERTSKAALHMGEPRVGMIENGDRCDVFDSWFERFASAARYRGARIPTKYVKLRRWLEQMQGCKVVKVCAKTEHDYISFFDQYGDPLPTG